MTPHLLTPSSRVSAMTTSLSKLSPLLWAVRFEKLSAVRAEACHIITSLKLKRERVVKTLQDLLTVDDELLVLK